jgi:tetratricopeptide (TPR) repeat protein
MSRILLATLLFLSAACAQELDSARVGIHQLESNLHRWDVLRVDSLFPELIKGKEAAQQGRLDEAEAEFKSGLKHHEAKAFFDLGVLAFERQRYKQALSFFRKCARIQKDSTVPNYIGNTERLLRLREEHP